MTVVHLIYPHGPSISCPDAIGRNLGKRLEQRYQVAYYDWDELRTIRPAPGDVLVGHPHPALWTCFRRSMSQPGWRRVLILMPYHHGDNWQVSFVESIIEHPDLYLAITGNYWFASIEGSLYSRWCPKMVHVDLAVERQDFPTLKMGFSARGQRRFVYIGHSGWTKNTKYLGRIARAAPEMEVAWMGWGRRGIPGVRTLGYQDFSTEAGQQAVAAYDFMITVGKADANPATILEAMAWGLIPVCTAQSGYTGYPGIVNLPLDDVNGAVSVLRELQELPEATLRDMQAANWKALDEHFNWDRFTNQVIEAIESDVSPMLGSTSTLRRLYIRLCALASPHAPWRFMNMARTLRRALGGLRDRA